MTWSKAVSVGSALLFAASVAGQATSSQWGQVRKHFRACYRATSLTIATVWWNWLHWAHSMPVRMDMYILQPVLLPVSPWSIYTTEQPDHDAAFATQRSYDDPDITHRFCSW